MGDVQQPLHTTALFSAEFPNGDKGGNAFTIIASEGRGTINLHTFWDGLIIGSENFREVTNQAILILNNPNLQRSRLTELQEQNFTKWAKMESVNLARDAVYQNGALKTNSTLTQAYRDKAKEVGERRIALAGYRLADVLVKLFDASTPIVSNPPVTSTSAPAANAAPIYGNRRSMIYHLSNCPNYKDIAPQNRVEFKTEAEAQQAGYRKAKNCP